MAKYHIEVVEIEELTSLDGDWQASDYAALLSGLDAQDITGLSSEETEEMCLMALQDLDHAEAGAIVLKYKLGDVLTEGQIRNYSNECQSERLWEQSAEIELHRAMFGVASLLDRVDEHTFPTPQALCVTLHIKCDVNAAKVFDEPVDRAMVARMLASGMDENAVILRLFDEAITGADFPEADHIIWGVVVSKVDDGLQVRVTSSDYWLDELRETEAFEWGGPLKVE